ncbi:MAG: carbohydrate kinase family protein [Promethearchaeota archaeon]
MRKGKVIIVGEMHNDLFYKNDAFKQMEVGMARAITARKADLASMDARAIQKLVHTVLTDLPKKLPGISYIKRGGNGNNSTELFAKLGVPIKLMTVVGRGAGWMIQEMAEMGVDTSCIFQLDETTPISTVIEDPVTTKIFTAVNLKKKMNFSTVKLDDTHFKEGTIVFFTPLALKFKPVLEQLHDLNLDVAKAITIERQAIDSLELLDEILDSKVDMMFINKRDALHLTGLDDLDEADGTFKRYCNMRIYTLGSKGAVIKSELCDDVHIPVFNVEVIDRSGAGDAFAAGFLLKCHECIEEEGTFMPHLKGLSSDVVHDRLKKIGVFGNAVASLKVSLARTPSGDEVRDFLEKMKK